MNREEIADELERLQIDYRHVYDGGCAEIRAIREWASRLDSASREILWDILFESVANQHPKMWGVAVEVLVEERPDWIAEKLDTLLTDKNSSEQLRDEIVFSLLRLGYRKGAAKYICYVKEALFQNGRENVLRLLAASCRVNAGECLELSSQYFGLVLRREGSEDEYAGIILAFIKHFLDVDEHLLGELVKRTKVINANAGIRLAGMIRDYFTKPWFIREVA